MQNPSANISHLTPVAGEIWFSVDEHEYGREPWVFDPETETTRLLRDLVTGNGNGVPEYFFEWKGDVYFVGFTRGIGRELMRSDGTKEGTRVVADIFPVTSSKIEPQFFAPMEEQIVFVANGGSQGYELWRTDGTEAGTRQLNDLHPSSVDIGTPFPPVDLGGYIVFRTAPDGGSGELWRCLPDGSEAEKISPPNVHVESFHGGFVPLGEGVALFVAKTDEEGVELWRTDGTPEGTFLLRDIFEGPSNGDPGDLTIFGDWCVFRATSGTIGTELWRTDGTPEGTVLIRDIAPGRPSGDPSPFRVSGERFFFPAETRANGRELWVSDGTEGGTQMVLDMISGRESGNPYAIAPCGDFVFFSGDDGTSGEELWRTDGTAEGTFLVRDIFLGPESSEPYQTCCLEGIAYFEANDGRHGSELWRSDGTTEGTYMLADIGLPSRQNTSASPSNLTAATDGALYFVASRADGTRTFFVQPSIDAVPFELGDGFSMSSQETVLNLLGLPDGVYTTIADEQDVVTLWFIPRNGDGAEVRASLGDREFHDTWELAMTPRGLYFPRYTEGQGVELWRLPHEGGEPEAVFEAEPGMGGSAPRSVTVWGDRIFWVANTSDAGEELWHQSADGAVGMVADVFPGREGSLPVQLTPGTDRIWFVANDGIHGVELWETRGTRETTRMVADINPVQSPLAHGPQELLPLGQSLFFTAHDTVHGRELWRLDVATGEATLVVDLFFGRPSSNPEALVALGDRIYFRAESHLKGVELFTSDGTSGGTYLVEDLALGPESSWPRDLTAFGGRVFFAARGGSDNDERFGHEVFYTDGASIELLAISPDNQGSGPSELTVADGGLYCSADDTITGVELWRIHQEGPNKFRTSLVVDLLNTNNLSIRRRPR